MVAIRRRRTTIQRKTRNAKTEDEEEEGTRTHDKEE